jgi:predicted RNA polymerase sigma factor
MGFIKSSLEIVLPLFGVPDMRNYHLLDAVAGDLLCRNGAHEQARGHFLHAAALTQNSAERTTMQRRASQCAARHAISP